VRLFSFPITHFTGTEVSRRVSIHQKQVLALFGLMLPFALVDGMGWFAVPVVTLITFTLYGIDGIGSQLEDPFGHDRNGIKMDFIVEDIRSEIAVLLEEWKRVGDDQGEMFIGPRGPRGGRSEPGVPKMTENETLIPATNIV
jgi:predicted membrane chloride channel (bestrophin family)